METIVLKAGYPSKSELMIRDKIWNNLHDTLLAIGMNPETFDSSNPLHWRKAVREYLKLVYPS